MMNEKRNMNKNSSKACLLDAFMGKFYLKPPLRHVSYMTEKIHEDKALRRT